MKKHLVKIFKPLISKQQQYTDVLTAKSSLAYIKELTKLLFRSSSSVLTQNNNVDIFYSGKEKFDYLIKDLKQAQHFIHLEYFIWRDDTLTSQIKDILINKVQEGVEVRILYDFVGSIFLKRSYIKKLRTKGIKIYPFFNFLSLFKMHTMNYRNHRKIVVIDGVIAYTGGMNMGKEYVDGGKYFPEWRDTHLRLKGEVVQILQAVFAIDWLNTTEEALFDKKYFPKISEVYPPLPMQVAISGADSKWYSIHQMYFSLINSAEKYVHIQSPYFVPDATIYTALKNSALRGVDVKLLITGRADKLLPYWAAFTYFEDLLKAGVKIYHYRQGFMHAKAVSIDGEVASVGTANMDVRSFRLNYELQVIMYDKDMAQNIDSQFETDIADARALTLDDYQHIPTWKKVRNSLARLFAPIL